MRSVRLTSYTEFLDAVHSAEQAAEAYTNSAVYVESYADDPQDLAELKATAAEQWRRYEAATASVARCAASVELVGSESLAWVTSMTARVLVVLPMFHLPGHTVQDAESAFKEWAGDRTGRYRSRQKFLRLARADLRTDGQRRPMQNLLVVAKHRLRRGLGRRRHRNSPQP